MKIFSRIPIFVIIFSTSLTAFSDGREIAGKWDGNYFYSRNQTSVSYKMTLVSKGNSFSGKCVEPATYGNGTSKLLYADILNGELSEDGEFHYTKKMDGTGGANHSILYIGSLSPDGKTAKGIWKIGDSGSGTFEMKRH